MAMFLQLTLDYENVLNLRLRMPISDDLHARSLLTKLLKYEKVRIRFMLIRRLYQSERELRF